VAVGLAGILVACDKNPTGPDASPYPRTLELSGPGTVSPGGTAQFTARATFFKTGGQSLDHFSGTVEPSRVTFQMYEGGNYCGFLYEFPDLFEEVSQGLLAIGGSAVTTASPGGRSGTLTGSFAIYDAGRRLTELCYSPAHRFELAR
jgi:hypothetical protein